MHNNFQCKDTKNKATGFHKAFEQVRICSGKLSLPVEFNYLRQKPFNVRKILFSFSLIALLAAGCRKGDPSWDTGLVLPLAHASLSIDNLIADSLVSTNTDGSVKLVYSTSFLGLSTDTLFDIPDTTYINHYESFLPINVIGGQYLVTNVPTQTAYDMGDLELVNGVLKEGKLFIRLQNDIQLKVIVSYSIPSATLNGVPFDTSFLMPAAVDINTSSIRNVAIDLSGYTIDFTGINHDRVNTVSTLFTAQIDPSEVGGVINGNNLDTVAAICTFSGIKPYYIRGYFGNQTIDIGPEETGFTIFQHLLSGTAGLDSLTMSLHIDNYVGMDSRLTINSIWSRNTRTGQSVYLNNSILGTPININRGYYSNTWPPVVPSSYNFVFDNSNSNAKALVENLPDKLGYDLTLITNPLGNVSGNNDFFYSDFGINANLDIEMPLNFYADQIVIGDTFVTDFTSVKNKEDILKGTLTLYAQNSFPFSAGVQLYLLDAYGNITDSIVAQPNVINAGVSSSAGNYVISTGFSSSTIQIPLNETQTQAFLNSSRIYFKALFDTNSAPGYVKIYNTNRLDLQLSADFDYHIGN